MGTRRGERYEVTEDEVARFERNGYVHLADVLDDAERETLDPVYDAFMRGEIEVDGRDLYDMVTGEFGTDPTSYRIFNVDRNGSAGNRTESSWRRACINEFRSAQVVKI